MEEKTTDQNQDANSIPPVPPVAQTPSSEPVSNVEKPLGSPEPLMKAAKLKFPIIVIVILTIVLTGTITFYFLINQKKPATSSKTTTTVIQNLNPNTGSFYKDVAQRLKEELK